MVHHERRGGNMLGVLIHLIGRQDSALGVMFSGGCSLRSHASIIDRSTTDTLQRRLAWMKPKGERRVERECVCVCVCLCSTNQTAAFGTFYPVLRLITNVVPKSGRDSCLCLAALAEISILLWPWRRILQNRDGCVVVVQPTASQMKRRVRIIDEIAQFGRR